MFSLLLRYRKTSIVLAVFLPCRMPCISILVGHMLDTCWTLLEYSVNDVKTCETLFEPLLETVRTLVGHFLYTCWTLIGHLLDTCRAILTTLDVYPVYT